VTQGAPDPPPPSREALAGALAANAAAKPLNIAALLVAFGIALVAGAPLIVALLVAMVVYAAAAARTMFDGAEADRVTAAAAGRSSAGDDADGPA
jgi:hypothetical protein